MADLSDPPAVILLMAEKIRAGADVVSGSRYMKGGSQTGGPFLKRTLSRMAGLSLYYLAGCQPMTRRLTFADSASALSAR